jgi:hypothetical protein
MFASLSSTGKAHPNCSAINRAFASEVHVLASATPVPSSMISVTAIVFPYSYKMPSSVIKAMLTL